MSVCKEQVEEIAAKWQHTQNFGSPLSKSWFSKSKQAEVSLGYSIWRWRLLLLTYRLSRYIFCFTFSSKMLFCLKERRDIIIFSAQFRDNFATCLLQFGSFLIFWSSSTSVSMKWKWDLGTSQHLLSGLLQNGFLDIICTDMFMHCIHTGHP